ASPPGLDQALQGGKPDETSPVPCTHQHRLLRGEGFRPREHPVWVDEGTAAGPLGCKHAPAGVVIARQPDCRRQRRVQLPHLRPTVPRLTCQCSKHVALRSWPPRSRSSWALRRLHSAFSLQTLGQRRGGQAEVECGVEATERSRAPKGSWRPPVSRTPHAPRRGAPTRAPAPPACSTRRPPAPPGPDRRSSAPTK